MSEPTPFEPAATSSPAPQPQTSVWVFAVVGIILAFLFGLAVGREIEQNNRYDTYWLLGATFGQSREGVYIDSVYPSSPADLAGLQSGDLVGAIDGRPVTTSGEARRLIGSHNPGDQVQITYRRGGFSDQATVTLGFLIVVRPEPYPVPVDPVYPTVLPPPPIVGTSEEGRLGVYYRMIEPGDPFSVRNGALIITAWPGGPADGAGLEAGDIILQVGQQTISGRQTLDDMLGRYQAGEVVLLRVLKTDGRETSVRVQLSN